MRVSFYTTGSGKRPVQEFIAEQSPRLQAAFADAVDGIEMQGLRAAEVSFRQIRGKLWEIRIRAGGAVRIFYFVRGSEEIVLLHAYVKKTERAPGREIEVATRRMGELTSEPQSGRREKERKRGQNEEAKERDRRFSDALDPGPEGAPRGS